MNAPIALLGCLLLLLVLADASITALSMVRVTGPVTGWVTRGVWRLFLAAHTRKPGGGLLQWSGTVTLLVTFLTWTLLLWAGWLLFFASHERAVVGSLTSAPADGWSRVYFTGYTVFTLGTGDYVPGTAWAQVATAVAALSGLFLVTLSLTYLVQVVQAVVHKRSVAVQVHALGPDAGRIVAGGWTGDGFSSMFNQHLVSLTEPLLRMGEQHLAFPVVHYFHSNVRGKAPACAVADLDDALLLLRAGTDPRARPDPAATGPLWAALGQVLDNLQGRFFSRAERERPAPALSALHEAGVPAVDEERYAAQVREQARRRRAVQGFLHSDGWRDGRPDS
ncbi:potassium channel family protein [Streptomyces sp. TRM 70361]|uniref:potassium channel family protein n=1 Tax=Streptomyces sp. TRM 70361 TaxID=3116553 RepID=UPI002E7ABFB7|nr:potassium channel family protein [Streptomyces sp. TRM 70361]MEE1940301.1 potassium channel family protein [Streptomyces sp. TRM 70361]